MLISLFILWCWSDHSRDIEKIIIWTDQKKVICLATAIQKNEGYEINPINNQFAGEKLIVEIKAFDSSSHQKLKEIKLLIVLIPNELLITGFGKSISRKIPAFLKIIMSGTYEPSSCQRPLDKMTFMCQSQLMNHIPVYIGKKQLWSPWLFTLTLIGQFFAVRSSPNISASRPVRKRPVP